MSDAAYERQHLATQAAGFINAAGTTAISFGCQMTRFAAGHYGLLLDASSGVINDETFSQVQTKGTALRSITVQDVSNVQKSIRTFDAAAVAADTDIEIILLKSVTK